MTVVRRLGSKLRILRQRSGSEDAVLALAVLVLGLLPLGVRGLELGELPNTATSSLAVVLTVGTSLPLCVRRVYPVSSASVIALAWVAAQLTGASVGVAGLGLLIAVYTVAAHQRKNRWAVAIASTALYAAVAVALSSLGSPEMALDYFTFFVVLVVPCLIGRVVRSSRLLQEERRRHAAEAAVQGVLQDLALDLHDVVTHHVTAIVVQAESVAYLTEADRHGRDETLKVIATAGRRALNELRELLGAIDPNAGDVATIRRPLPDVAGFLRQLAQEGHPISLETVGQPVELDDAMNTTLYRWAQEAVSNAFKHGNGGTVWVRLTHSPSMVELTVRNSLGVQASKENPSGRGLGNMRHRVELVGGTMTAGVVGDEFNVAALLPTRQR